MSLQREHINQFIDTIYWENKTIVMTAPSGFGKFHSFSHSILTDLMKSPKKCLMVFHMKSIMENAQELFFENIQNLSHDRMNVYNIVKNRSKTFVHFKNGSVIDYKICTELRGVSSDDYDILYIDSFRNIRSLYYDIRYLFGENKKVIVMDDEFSRREMIGDYPCDSVKTMVKDYKPIYSIHIRKPEDLMSEIRKLKLKKIHATIRNKSR